jgi:hypothetical protein
MNIKPAFKFRALPKDPLESEDIRFSGTEAMAAPRTVHPVPLRLIKPSAITVFAA